MFSYTGHMKVSIATPTASLHVGSLPQIKQMAAGYDLMWVARNSESRA